MESASSINGLTSEVHSTPSVGNRNGRTAAGARLRGVGVLGLGYWGPNHVRNLYHLRCAETVYACDLDAKRREHIQRLYPGVVPLANFDDLLNNPGVDAIIVATPVSTHFPWHSRLRAGKSVLVEKPLATSRHEALSSSVSRAKPSAS